MGADLLLSYKALLEGRREDGKGQGAGVVQVMWTGVEKEENPVEESGSRCRAKAHFRHDEAARRGHPG